MLMNNILLVQYVHYEVKLLCNCEFLSIISHICVPLYMYIICLNLAEPEETTRIEEIMEALAADLLE